MNNKIIKMFDKFRIEFEPEDQCKDIYEFTKLLKNCENESDVEELVNEYFYGSWNLKHSNTDDLASIFEQVTNKHGEETQYDNSGYILEIIWR